MNHHGNDATANWQLTRDLDARARRLIRAYCTSGSTVVIARLSPYTLNHLVGMIESGEADAADFEAVGGPVLRDTVYEHKAKLDKAREGNQCPE